MDQSSRKVFNILSYIGPLFLVGLLAAREDGDVQFHVRQGMRLFIFEIACGLLSSILRTVLGWLPLVGSLLSWLTSFALGILCLALMVIGIVNGANDAQKTLPIIGELGNF